MRRRRLVKSVVAIVMVLALLVGSIPMGVSAQDTPIEPISPGEPAAEETNTEGVPDQLVVGGQRYHRDLAVPADLNPMQEQSAESGETVFVKPGESDPLGAVYLPLDDGSGLSIRYYPERLGQSDAVCPADLADPGTLSGNGATYVTAGPEPDFTADSLEPLGTVNNDTPIYGVPGDDEMRNIFVAQNSGQGTNSLVRFVLQGTDGVPATLEDPITFAGQEFTSAPGAIGSLDGLTRVGCAGLFPVYSEWSEQPFATIALDVAGDTVAFEPVAGDAPAPTEDPGTPAPTEDPGTPVPTDMPATPEPTVEPTAEATPEPTAEPTAEATPEPTEEPTAEPTEEPTAEATQEPTQEPTAEPTDEPTAEATAEPTSEPTSEPTTESTAEPTAEATGEPTAEPTPEPTAEPTIAADADLGEEPEALPTEAPPTPEEGQPTPTPAPVRPTPTPRPLQPQAVVPTLPPDVPSPAAGQSDVISCSGNTGELDDNGVPERLPRNLQYAGEAYRYTGQVAVADAGDVEATGCVGPFVLYLPADAASDTNIYLGMVNEDDSFFVFEQTVSLSVGTQTRDDEQPRSLNLEAREDAPSVRYRASDPWQPSIYSSLSLEIYVADAEAELPDRFVGYSVGFDVFGEYVLEGEAEGASQEVLDRAESLGVHPTLTFDGQRYVLVALWTPFGTTTNGWLTLYGIEGESSPDQLIGLDPRRQDLLVFNAER